MATIFSRLNKDGSSTYRVMIRRKGVPILCLSFLSLKEAKEWVNLNEKSYIKYPKELKDHLEKERLFARREREFKRKLI